MLVTVDQSSLVGSKVTRASTTICTSPQKKYSDSDWELGIRTFLGYKFCAGLFSVGKILEGTKNLSESYNFSPSLPVIFIF